jgi:hypothetical protein
MDIQNIINKYNVSELTSTSIKADFQSSHEAASAYI